MIDNSNEDVAKKLIEKFFPDGDYHIMYSLLTSTFDNDDIKVIYDYAVTYGDESSSPKTIEPIINEEPSLEIIFGEINLDRNNIYNYEFDKETMDKVYEEMFKKHREEFEIARAKPPVDDVLADDPNWQIQHKLFWDYIDENHMADFYRDIMGLKDPEEITKLIYGKKEPPEGFKKKILRDYNYEIKYQAATEEELTESVPELASTTEEHIEPLTAADFEPGELEKIHATYDKEVKRNFDCDSSFLINLWHFQKQRYQRRG